MQPREHEAVGCWKARGGSRKSLKNARHRFLSIIQGVHKLNPDFLGNVQSMCQISYVRFQKIIYRF